MSRNSVFGEVHLGTPAEHLALLRDQLEVTEDEPFVPRLQRADTAQQGADARRELLGRERLGEVVVGPGLEAGDDVVGVVARRDHDDGDVARAAQRAAQLEPVDAREHDVDEHDVGHLLGERLDRLLAGARPLDRPTLVLERQLDRFADPLVVFNGQDSCSHAPHDA